MGLFTRKDDVAETVGAAATSTATATATATESDFDQATTAVADLTGDYALDPTHSRLGFSVRHAMITTVRGSFTEFDGTAHIDIDNPSASHASVRIGVASVDTGQEQRDEHLRNGDFFDAPAFPEITFVSTSAEKRGEDTVRLTGDLTIKDVTRPVAVDFELVGSAKDPYGNVRAGFEGSAVLNRKDWGLTYNAALETGGVLISDKIKLEFDVSAIQAAA